MALLRLSGAIKTLSELESVVGRLEGDAFEETEALGVVADFGKEDFAEVDLAKPRDGDCDCAPLFAGVEAAEFTDVGLSFLEPFPVDWNRALERRGFYQICLPIWPF